jgi:VWFA-related protein
MNARVCCAVGAMVALGLLAGRIEGQNQLVLVDVAVEDGGGAAVQGLAAGEVEIHSEGRTIPAATVAFNRQPLNIVLLVDVSASMARDAERKQAREHLEEDLEKAFNEALQPGERARIGGFAGALKLSTAFTQDRRMLSRALDAALSHPRSTLFGPSPIWDHAATALDALATSQGRRALVLVTDGRGSGNHRSITDIAEQAVRTGTTLHVLGHEIELYIPQDATSAVIVRPGNQLQWVAGVTGGQYFHVGEQNFNERGQLRRDTALRVQQLLTALRSTYTIGFEPPVDDGRLHVIEVRIKRGNLVVRAPRLFLAPANR